MTALTMPSLESLHQNTGLLLKYGQRLFCAMIVMGTLFCMFSYAVAKVLKQPEAFLHTQGFMFNYAEMAQGDAAPYMKTNNLPMLPDHPKDPNWDGTVAGASVGFTIGQNNPIIGSGCGPVFGALLGYQLDSRI
jgi:hypothetical protein